MRFSSLHYYNIKKKPLRTGNNSTAKIQIFLHHSALQLFESCFIRCADTLLSGLNNTMDCDKEKHEDTKAVI
jgi:hypothetical protein